MATRLSLFCFSLFPAVCLTVFSLLPAAAQLTQAPNGGIVQPQDVDDLSPADIRANYLKRYPYANQNDPVQNGASQSGSSQSYQAYSLVLQPCLGGLVGAINSAVSALSSADSALQSALGGLGGGLGQALGTQAGQLGQFSTTSLPLQISQGQSMLQIPGGLPVPPNALAAYNNVLNQQKSLNTLISTGAPWTGSNPQVPISKLGLSQQQQQQLKQQLGLPSNATTIPASASGSGLGSFSMSFVTDNKWCMGKDEICSTIYPPLMHFFYVQWPKTASVSLASQRDADALSKGIIQTYGLPMSDTQYQVIDREDKQRFLELLFDPERIMWKELSTDQTRLDSVANSLGGAGAASFAEGVNQINTALINVANEASASGSGIGQAIGYVQQMYKKVFIPIGVLLLLLGTVLSQTKGPICYAFGLQGDEPLPNPISGLMRAIVAIVLIPGTQMIISYATDIGNTMAYEVSNPSKQWIQTNILMQWAQQQTFHPPVSNLANAINPVQQDQGKAQNQLANQVTQEDQSYLSGMTQVTFNGASCLTSLAVVILTAFQLVLMCYLMLMGPVVAAFYAWPSGVGSLFRDVFSNWMRAVITLCLWRFYWCVILAVMTQRIIYVHPQASSEWEMMIFSSFMTLLLYVPFQPFTFDPGEVGGQIFDKLGSSGGGSMAGATGGAGGAGGTGGAMPSAATKSASGGGSGGSSAPHGGSQPVNGNGTTGSATGGSGANSASSQSSSSQTNNDAEESDQPSHTQSSLAQEITPVRGIGPVSVGSSGQPGRTGIAGGAMDESVPPPPRAESGSNSSSTTPVRKVVALTSPPPLAVPLEAETESGGQLERMAG